MIVIGDLLECAVYCRSTSDQNSVNVLHFQVEDDGGGAYDLDEVADQLSTQLAAYYKPLLSTASKFVGCAVRRKDSNPTAVYKTTSGAGLGSNGNSDAPPQLSVIINTIAPFTYPRLRGRVYFPFPCITDVDADGSPTASYLANLETWADQVLIGVLTLTMAGDDVQLVYKIRKAGTPPTLVTPREVLIRDRFATQRRRSLSGKVDDLLS